MNFWITVLAVMVAMFLDRFITRLFVFVVDMYREYKKRMEKYIVRKYRPTYADYYARRDMSDEMPKPDFDYLNHYRAHYAPENADDDIDGDAE